MAEKGRRLVISAQTCTRRLICFLCGFQFLFLCCLVRLAWLQGFESPAYHRLAALQHRRVITLPPQRGAILDRHGRPLAVNANLESVYAIPPIVQQKPTVAREVARITGLDEKRLLERLGRRKSFVWLARRLPLERADQIRQLRLAGIDFLKEPRRFYPNGPLASHIIGYAGLDHEGLEGVELSCDGQLRGEPGWRLTCWDAKGRAVASRESQMVPPLHGRTVVLTIDQVVQDIAERELERAVARFHAKGGTVVVLDPHTGEVLAMANRPTFDPNHFEQVQAEARRNRAITDMCEPGSGFKIVTASAALNDQLIPLQELFDCENGAYRVGGHILHDHRPNGLLTFQQVIEKSSNIGTVKVAQRIGGARVWRYALRYGFGERTGIDLPGEASGFVRHPRRWSKLTISAFPIGQEVLTTPLQLASAVSVVANGGVWVRPRVVREVVDPSGTVVRTFERGLERRVIDEETARTLKEVLAGVVERGTGRAAAPPGYSAGGKTGTAQKIEPNGTYSHSRFVASFLGFAPADDPVITVVVMLDEPRPLYLGGQVAAPTFSRIVEAALRYLQVPPQAEPDSETNGNPPTYLTQRR